MSTTTEQLEARSHHTTSPSTLGNREACPCWESRQTEHVRSIAGTLAHAVVEKGIDNDLLSDEDAMAAAECLDFIEYRKQSMENARFNRIKQFVNSLSAGKDHHPNGEELELRFPSIVVLREEYLPVDDCAFDDGQNEPTLGTTAGYVDHIILDFQARYAEMVDYKFGVWPVEDAAVNLQGIAYVLGVFKKFRKIDTIRFFFKQPLIESMSEAVFSRSDIPKLYLRIQTVVARTRLARIKKTEGDWSMATPRIPACNFCNEIGRCPKVGAFALQVGQKFFPVEIPADIDPIALHDKTSATLCMRLAQLVTVWASAFKTQLTNRILEGRAEMPSGFKLTTSTRRELTDKEAFKRVALTYLTEHEYNATLDVLFGAVEKAISNKSPRGSKEKTVEEFREKLYEASAVADGLPFTFLKATAGKKNEQTETK